MKLIILPFLFLVLTSNAQNMNPDQTIQSTFEFELEKYLGTWYEIARFDHSFERELQGVTATYKLKDDGKIEVLNQGNIGNLDGKLKKAIGKAKLTSPENPRNLKVSFFWIFYSPYNILELGENYEHALIGTGSKNYLWILSRTPQISEQTFNELVGKAKARGYDTSKLIIVEQVH